MTRSTLGRDRLQEMMVAASATRSRAYAPYSGFRVGAAVLTQSGHLYAGCNVENSTYGATLCAERSAVAAMVCAGDAHPIACAVVVGGTLPASPCGICRQVFAEFAREMRFVLVAEDESGRITAKKSARLSELLPRAFRFRKTSGR